MHRSYVTDIRHLLDEEGRPADGPAGKLARYFGLIVEAGSVMNRGQRGDIPMRCANPTQRKRCFWQLLATLSPDGSIEWECLGCRDRGSIANWAGTSFDLSSVRTLQTSEEKPNVILPLHELDAARRLCAGEPLLRRLLAEAAGVGDNYLCFPAGYEELLWLRDTAVTASDAARGEDRRMLDRFSARMDAFMTTLAEVMEDDDHPHELLN